MNNQDIPPWVDDPSIPSDDPSIPSLPATRETKGQHKGRPDEKYVTFQGYIYKETEKAILFECIRMNGSPLLAPGEEGKKEWFPLSQTKSITRPAPSETADGEYDNITVTQWIARTKGFPA